MKIRVEAPCEEEWDTMEPRKAGRFCQKCQETVLDLSHLSARQARKAIRARGKGEDYVCINLRVDEHEEPIFRPEPERLGLGKSLTLVAALATGCSAAAAEEPEFAAPCEAPMEPSAGPPMLPIAPTPPAAPVVTTSTVATPTEDRIPTAEQYELERQKATRRTIRHVRGRMPLRRISRRRP